MPKKRTDIYLADIIMACKRIEEYVEGFDRNKFDKDTRTQDAVIRQLAIIGEASKKVPKPTKSKNPNIDWRAAAGMRDVLIHDYPNVIVKVVWETATKDVPKLLEDIKKLI
jgi:uncharacterized protein with HEPN domain